MRTMLKTAALTALMLTAFVSTAAAQVSIGIQIGPPPPPPVVRVAPVAAAPGYEWVQGYWYPAGPAYRWRAGYWAAPPYAGAYWVAPRYQSGRYYGGYWGSGRYNAGRVYSNGRSYGSSRGYTYDRRR